MGDAVLVGDVGGTHSRWARYDGTLGPVTVTSTSAVRTLKEAVVGLLGDAKACGVAVAGPIVERRVRLTNAQWEGHEDDLGVPVALVNDLEAVALSVPQLKGADVVWWGRKSNIGDRVLCLGIGTGFGGAVWADGHAHSMEPGHESLGYFEPFEREVTVEEVVSGLAIKQLNAAGVALESVIPDAFEFALQRLVNRWSPETILLMGGVAEARPDLFEPGAASVGVPVAHIVHPHPALLGAARAAQHRLIMQ